MTDSSANLVPTPTPTPAAAPAPPVLIVLRISVPSLGVQKAIRCPITDSIWSVKKQIIEKISTDLKEALNYGMFAPGTAGKQGKFLEEKRDLQSYGFENNVSITWTIGHE